MLYAEVVLCTYLWCERRDHSRFVFFLMIRRPPRSTQSRSSAASDVYKRQVGQIVNYCNPPGDGFALETKKLLHEVMVCIPGYHTKPG